MAVTDQEHRPHSLAPGAEGPKPVGIKDVAAAAGVSLTTVSHALNGKGRISHDTRLRVVEAAAALGYRPNSAARDLAGGRTGMIDLMLNARKAQMFEMDGSAFHSRLLGAAAAACLERDLSLLLTGLARLPRVAGSRADGVIGMDPLDGESVWEEIEAQGIPLVTIGRRRDAPNGYWVDSDWRAVAAMLCDHFERRGAKRIAMVASDVPTPFEREYREGYRAWCAAHRRPPLERTASEASEAGGLEAMEALCALTARPDAVFATGTRLTGGLIAACRKLGLAIPQDVMIAGGNDCEFESWTDPSVTTLDLSPDRLGRCAVDMLVGLIDRSRTDPAPVVVPARLVERGSTARLPASR